QRVELTSGWLGGPGLALRLPPALALAVVGVLDLEPTPRAAADVGGFGVFGPQPLEPRATASCHAFNPSIARRRTAKTIPLLRSRRSSRRRRTLKGSVRRSPPSIPTR